MSIKPNGNKRMLRFGDFIVAAYEVRTRRRAKGLVRLAVNAQLIEFHGGQRFVVTRE